MKIKKFKIKTQLGLHARPAAHIANLTKNCRSVIKICKDNTCIDPKDILEVMLLDIRKDETFKVSASGIDEDIFMDSIKKLIDTINEEEI